MGTTFYEVYCRFLDKITDDMFMELELDETFQMLDSILYDSLSEFRFPRFRLFKYDKDYEALTDEDGNVISYGAWEDTLTHEEINIITNLMLVEWFRRQLATTRITQMKYSTSDFKMTSQAAHMQRLNAIIESKTKEVSRQQHMYQRRVENEEGYIVANYDGLSSGEKMYMEAFSSLGALGRGIGNDC